MNKIVENHSPDQSPVKEAGAITFRKNSDGRLEVLLIFSKKKPLVRIFPKGHIEPGEQKSDAAQRELLEEAGVAGRLVREAGTISYEFGGRLYQVTYYLLLFASIEDGGEDGRCPEWFSLEEALALLPFEQLRVLCKNSFIKIVKHI